MKHIYVLISFYLIFSSCNQRYQIFVLESDHDGTEKNNFTYQDTEVRITYDFWADGGIMLFNIENKSLDTVFFHMNASELVVNNEPFKYYIEAVNLQLDPPDSNIELSYSPNLRFDPIVTIPPGANRWLEGFPIVLNWQRINLSNNDHSKRYSATESPIEFRNILRYSNHKFWTNKVIENKFWVSMVREASKSRFRIINKSDLTKTDKFYASRKLGKDNDQFWLDLGLGILQAFTYFL